jgi:hypothetical protein
VESDPELYDACEVIRQVVRTLTKRMCYSETRLAQNCMQGCILIKKSVPRFQEKIKKGEMITLKGESNEIC